MPEGWRTVRLGDVLVSDNSKLGAHGEEPVVFSLSKYDGVVLADDYFDKRIASDKLDGYKVLGPGGWAYSTIHIDEGSIATNRHGLTGVLSPMYTTMRWVGQDDDPRYFELLLRTPRMLTVYRDHAAGTVNRRRSLAYKAFAELRVDVPPLVVQRRVVDLVDALDTYAAAARARHETARAARNAVISERLLQGSGDGWERTTLGEAAEVTIGRQRSPKNATGDHMTNYLRAANVKDGYLDLSDVKEMNFSPHEQDTYGLRPGDVLVTEGCGSLAQLGACAVWNGGAYEGPVCFQNTLIRLRSTERTDPGFLGLWGQWAFETGLFASIATGTNIFHLGVEQTRRLPLHLPPIPVQRDLSALASAFGSEIEGSAAAEKAALATRSALLDELLSGEREVPGSYDELVGLVA